MSNELISILVLNYNNSKLLNRSINSCINQTYKNLEVLIFDDKSTDNSVKLLKNIKKKHKIKFFVNKQSKFGEAALDAKNGYITLLKHAKGEIIFLLDSDDYFKKNKVKQVINAFKINRQIDLIQDLPLIKNKNKFKNQKNKNNFLSYWPYFSPESCLSFKRRFIKKFIKANWNFSNEFEYKNVWLGFRLCTYSYFITKSFYSLNKNLTIYESQGESKKYKIFRLNWFMRRLSSFNYLKKVSKNKINLNYNYDFLITNIFIKFLNLFK
jgi:glycosyltransferase involved in cell wall biosynthesis